MDPHTYRSIQSKPPAVQQAPSDPAIEGATVRRREVTATACDRCRERKIKCNGGKPVCRSCARKKERCHYQSRQQTNRELEAANQVLRNIVGSLREGTLHDSINVLQKLRTAQDTDNALGSGYSHIVDGVAPSLAPPSVNTHGRFALPLSQWTRVSNDDQAMLNLLNVLWTWDTTLTKIIHRGVLHEHICSTASQETDTRNHSEVQFCSRFLVNALLAVATVRLCPSLLLEPTSFLLLTFSTFLSLGYGSANQAQLHANSNNGDLEPRQLSGHAFAEEAMSTLNLDRAQPTLALLQGMTALWMYEHLSGKSQSASQLLDELLSVHSQLETKGYWNSLPVPISSYLNATTYSITEQKREKQALSYASWGFYFLDLKLCLSFNSTTQILRPRLPMDFGSDAWHAVDDNSVNLWIPYPITPHPQLSYFMEIHSSEAQLNLLGGAIILEAVNNSASPMPDCRLAIQLYNQISGWRRTSPRGPTAEPLSNPTLVSLSITADVLALRLLEPFVHLSFLDFDRGRSARSLIALHCESVFSMLWNYRTAFGMRHDGWHLQACSLAAQMLMSHLSPDLIDGGMSIKSCMLLHAMGPHMPVANEALLRLRTITERRKINLPSTATTYLMAGCLKTDYAIDLDKVSIVNEGSRGPIGGGLVLQGGTLSFADTIQKIRTESVVANVAKLAVDDGTGTLPASENTHKTS